MNKLSFMYLPSNSKVNSSLTVPQFSSVQSLSRVPLFATPWIKACQASLSITNSHSLLKPMSIASVMPSNHLILCRPLLLLPPIPPSIRVFSNESTLRVRWPKYWSFSFSISASNEHISAVTQLLLKKCGAESLNMLSWQICSLPTPGVEDGQLVDPCRDKWHKIR